MFVAPATHKGTSFGRKPGSSSSNFLDSGFRWNDEFEILRNRNSG